MSAISGPNIITDGLIYYLDAANYRSLPAEPTVNIMNNWLDGTFTGWITGQDGGGSGTYQILTDSTYGYKIQYTNTGNAGRYYLRNDNSLSASGKYSTSIYVKPLSWNDSNSRFQIYCDFYGDGGPYWQVGVTFYLGNKTIYPNNFTENIFTEDVGNGWYRIGFTTSFTDGTTGMIFLMLYDSSVVEVAWPQTERKNYVTPFVNGTRNTWYDISPSKYDTTIYNGIYNRTSKTFNLDGSSTYFSCGNNQNLTLSGDATIQVWLKILYPWPSGNYPNIVSKGCWAGWDTTGWAVFCFNPDVHPYPLGIGMHNGSTNQTPGAIPAESLIRNSYFLLTAQWNSTEVWMYQNLSLDSYSPSKTISPGSTTENFLIGRDGQGRTVFGDIGVVKIYNRVLSLSEITQNYNSLKSRYGLQ